MRRKHVVFGKLILGNETLKKIEHVEVEGSRPVVPVKIVHCGELKESKDQSTLATENGHILFLSRNVIFHDALYT